MSLPDDGIQAEPKQAIWNTPLTLDFKGFFFDLAKATAFTIARAYDEATASAIDSLSKVGMAESNEQLAGQLIVRSTARGITALLRYHLRDFSDEVPKGLDSISRKVAKELLAKNIKIGVDFFDKPSLNPIVSKIQNHLEVWLEFRKVGNLNPKTIASRFPDFFVWGLHLELRERAIDYSDLINAIQTPVAEAWQRTRTWENLSMRPKKTTVRTCI